MAVDPLIFIALHHLASNILAHWGTGKSWDLQEICYPLTPKIPASSTSHHIQTAYSPINVISQAKHVSVLRDSSGRLRLTQCEKTFIAQAKALRLHAIELASPEVYQGVKPCVTDFGLL